MLATILFMKPGFIINKKKITTRLDVKNIIYELKMFYLD